MWKRVEGTGSLLPQQLTMGQIICSLGHLQPLWLTTGVFCHLEMSSGGTSGRTSLLGWTLWFIILLFGTAANILAAVGMYWRRLALNSPVQQMLLGLAHVFQGQGGGKWILLKHGNKTWSVFVCDNEFTRGWGDFCDAHDLQVNYKVVIDYERQWVFEVFVLDNTNISFVYPWSRADHGWQSLLPLPENIVSSCLPSTMERQQLDLKFMLLVTPGADFLMELLECGNQLFKGARVHEIKVKMGARAWIVPFVDGSLDSVFLGQFVVALELGVFDRVFVVVSPTLELHVIVFENDGAERIYEWVVYPSLA